jgi:hypothetical protein
MNHDQSSDLARARVRPCSFVHYTAGSCNGQTAAPLSGDAVNTSLYAPSAASLRRRAPGSGPAVCPPKRRAALRKPVRSQERFPAGTSTSGPSRARDGAGGSATGRRNRQDERAPASRATFLSVPDGVVPAGKRSARMRARYVVPEVPGTNNGFRSLRPNRGRAAHATGSVPRTASAAAPAGDSRGPRP